MSAAPRARGGGKLSALIGIGTDLQERRDPARVSRASITHLMGLDP